MVPHCHVLLADFTFCLPLEKVDKPVRIFENVPLPVLTKSYSGNDEIVYLYRRNTQVSLERIDGLTDGQFYL